MGKLHTLNSKKVDAAWKKPTGIPCCTGCGNYLTPADIRERAFELGYERGVVDGYDAALGELAEDGGHSPLKLN